MGNIRIDTATVEKLENAKGSVNFDRIAPKYEENEHSLEMHCPYIRKIFKDKDISMVPLMVGDIPKDKFPDYARELLPLFMDERTLFIVSSDFCHWGERFDFMWKYKDEPKIYKGIERLDKEGMSKIESQKREDFEKYLNETKNTICGR